VQLKYRIERMLAYVMTILKPSIVVIFSVSLSPLHP